MPVTPHSALFSGLHRRARTGPTLAAGRWLLRTRPRCRRVLRGATAALAVFALFAAVLVPAASAQSRAVGTVIIANGWSPADSAVASALAALESDGSSDAVVLYANSSQLTTRTANFIRDRQPSAVILVGGTAALSAAVHDEVVVLVGGAAVRRIEGTDRFDTAAKAVPSNATTFIVANGYSAADTGVAAALAATRANAAVLLATADSLTEPTERIISERQPAQVEFVGGTVVLAASLADRVRELAPSVASVPRHSGASRTDTAAAAAPSTSTTLVIANGWSPADMGVAAAYAAVTSGAAVLYSQTSSLTAPTERRIEALRPRAIVLVGGSAALDTSLHIRLRALAPTAALHRISGSDRIDTAVRAAAGTLTPIGTDPPAAPASLTAASRNAALAVSWSAPSSGLGAAVSGYVVEYRACTATLRTCASSPSWGSWIAHAHAGTGTSTTISGLVDGTAYQVRVRARNLFGLGSWSQTASGIPGTSTARPSVPSGVTAEAANQQLQVTWTASTPPSNGALTGYDVQYRACPAGSGCGSWTSHPHSGTGTSTTISRLSNGTRYEVQVRATSSRGDSTWSQTVSATPALLPSFERAPDLTEGDRQIVVRWNEPGYSGSAIGDYDVQYRACTATDKACPAGDDPAPTWGNWRDRSHSGTAQTTTITGLTNGTAYEVRVRARNATGVGPWSAAGQDTPVSVPARPSTPTLEAGNQMLVVTWTAPSDNGLAITGYDVEYCTGTCASNSEDWTDAGDEGTDTRDEIDGLTNGMAYKVRVRAVNSKGNGLWSSSRTGTPKALPDAPAPPTLVAGDRRLIVSWNAPANLHGTTVTGYDVAYRPCTATPKDCSSNPRWGSWQTRSRSDPDTLSYTLTSLTNATKYEVRVRARISGGVGPYSAVATANQTPLGKPSRPSTPTLTPGDAQLVVTWKAPAANGSAIIRYEVARCVSTTNCSVESNWQGSEENASDDDVTGEPLPTTHTFSSLTNGTTYRVRVRAVNAQGEGPWSPNASGTPSLRPDAPTDVHINPGPRRIGLSWTAPSGNGLDLTHYYVEYRACTATDSDSKVLTCDESPTWGNWVQRSYSATNISATITGLTNGTKYEARVRARNGNGVGPWSTVVSGTPLAAPSTPTGVTVERSNTQLVVSWTASVSNGSTISGYIVEHRACIATRKDCTSGARWNATWENVEVEGATLTTTIRDRTNGTAYQVRVRAKSASSGNSGWSQIKSAIVAAVPDAPAAPTLTGQDRQILVTWSEPEDNGSVIERYEVGYRACTATNADTTVLTCATTPTWGSWRVHSETSASLSRTITGLTNGAAYQVRVRAENENGWGPWNAPPVQGKPVGAPAAPTTPRVTIGDGSLTVDWIVPRSNGSNITGYEVRHRACTQTNGDATVKTCASNPTWGEGTTATVSGVSTTTATISGMNGTAIEIRVRATTGNGESPWSSPVIGIPVGVPSAPAWVDDVIATGNRRLVLTWSAPDAMGSAVTGFKVRYCLASGSCDATTGTDWTTRTVSGATRRTYTITGLTNGSEYKVQILTTSRDKGDSDWGSELPRTAAGGPSRVSTPRLTTPASQQITVTWTVPAKNHSDISQWDVQYRACTATNGSPTVLTCASNPTWGTWQPQSHSDVSSTTTTITGLTNGTKYQVRVRAVNAQGNGEWSSIATATPTP